MFAMFPLGIAYFVSLVTLLAVGGSLIWTFPGMLIVLATIFASRLVGDAESAVVSRVADVEIRRPPWRTEDIEGWRSRVWARLIDPTTWTGILYLFVQFPIGIGTFVSLVVTLTLSGAFVASPLIIHFTEEPLEFFAIGGFEIIVDTPVEAIWLIPIGLILFLLTVHFVNAFTFVHSRWAQFMLGSRTRPRTGPAAGDDDRGDKEIRNEASDVPTPTTPVQANQPHMGELRMFSPERTRVSSPETDIGASADDSVIHDLTQREREVLLLLARGMTNAEIAEEFVISQGTVKTHVKRILSKLELNDRTQVVVFAYENQLVRPANDSAPVAERADNSSSPTAKKLDRHRPLCVLPANLRGVFPVAGDNTHTFVYLFLDVLWRTTIKEGNAVCFASIPHPLPCLDEPWVEWL